MSDNLPQKDGFLRELFAGLPTKAKTFLMWILLPPLAIAISGMLLQINVGALIQDSLRQSRGQTVDIVGTMLTSKLDRLDRQLDDVQRLLSEQRDNYGSLDKRITLVERDIEYMKRPGAPVKPLETTR